MTVEELIDALQRCNPKSKVVYRFRFEIKARPWNPRFVAGDNPEMGHSDYFLCGVKQVSPSELCPVEMIIPDLASELNAFP